MPIYIPSPPVSFPFTQKIRWGLGKTLPQEWKTQQNVLGRKWAQDESIKWTEFLSKEIQKKIKTCMA